MMRNSVAFSLRLPFLAAVTVVSHQFLFLGVHGNDRQPLREELFGLSIPILKLSITIGMVAALDGIGIGLQTVPQLVERISHFAVADAVPLPL
jgi:hypothetical protein